MMRMLYGICIMIHIEIYCVHTSIYIYCVYTSLSPYVLLDVRVGEGTVPLLLSCISTVAS